MTVVAIHQPNYAPWLGYFVKIARADVFFFLDDVQYSKNSYINRVQVDAGGKARWLTLPVSYSFGDPINRVRLASEDWRKSHLDILGSLYRGAAAWRDVWPWLASVYEAHSDNDLAATNEALVTAIAEKLKLKCQFRRSSSVETGDMHGEDRLIALLRSCGRGVSYLSGKGGANYQSEAKFQEAGISLVYSDFAPAPYPQGHPEFLPGLSIYDALFRLGFEKTAALVAPEAAKAA